MRVESRVGGECGKEGEMGEIWFLDDREGGDWELGEEKNVEIVVKF